jgi:hypothetical protein
MANERAVYVRARAAARCEPARTASLPYRMTTVVIEGELVRDAPR